MNSQLWFIKSISEGGTDIFSELYLTILTLYFVILIYDLQFWEKISELWEVAITFFIFLSSGRNGLP